MPGDADPSSVGIMKCSVFSLPKYERKSKQQAKLHAQLQDNQMLYI